MTRYFFDVSDADFSAYDYDGTECSDRNAALEEALRTACEIAADKPQKYTRGKLQVRVRDESKSVVFSCAIELSVTGHGASKLATAA
ncbi:DUF6894 family protein [Methylobacterium oxalidis]|uniref:DUF6894 domain-containing protein n=1 Tax=Methylobacterium oxalidis TaxID=944322 RepID=A0A512JC26_9HYPH|nr:hypothetical protein [Methylobacterium oxalidis]GEP07506.1 hypothetical protein MOX02_55440 [Methylobacterium oxalidis]GLS65201.1 hypothetical protein GCM10007888_35830 [Methylobacterium oxalidis]